MGNNHSKPCCGVPERENRRAEQEKIQRTYMTQQARETSPDTAKATVHIYCGEDEVDKFLEETDAACITFHFKVEKSPEIKPENSPEGGEIRPFDEKPRAAEIASAVLLEAKVADPGEDATGKLEPDGQVLVTVEHNGDIVVGTDAQPTDLDLPLACLCNKVVHALQVLEKSFRDSSERTKGGHSAGKELLPSPTESHLSMLSSGSQTVSPQVGTANAGDVHSPKEEALLANDQKAPCEIDLVLAPENALEASEEPTTGQGQLDAALSGVTLQETPDAPLDLVSAETSDEHSGVKTNTGTAELAEILGNDLPEAVSVPRSIPSKMEEEIPDDCCDENYMETRLEVLEKRAQYETPAVTDSEDETERHILSKTFRTRELNRRAHRRSSHTVCKEDTTCDSDLVSEAVDSDNLQKDGAIPMPEVAKMNKPQTPVEQNREALPPTDVAEMTEEASSARALLDTTELRQNGTPEGSSACPVDPVVPGSRIEKNHIGAQLVTVQVLGTELQDGSSRQSC